MAVSGLLAQYMSIKAQISYYELQDTRWNNLATAMSKKLSEQENEQEKWDSKSVSFYDSYGDKKEFKAGGTLFQDANGIVPQNLRVYEKEILCKKYADAAVPRYDSEKLDEYTELDMEYSTMVAMYDTLLEELQAMQEGTKTQLSTEAQDTHLIQ